MKAKTTSKTAVVVIEKNDDINFFMVSFNISVSYLDKFRNRNSEILILQGLVSLCHPPPGRDCTGNGNRSFTLPI